MKNHSVVNRALDKQPNLRIIGHYREFPRPEQSGRFDSDLDAMADTPFRYHLTGWTVEGRRVNRKYKTMAACDKMMVRMTIINCSLLYAVTFGAIESALSQQR